MEEAKRMRWSDVMEKHGTAAGVSFRQGHVKSVLCGSSRHTDKIVSDQVTYTVPLTRGYKPAIRALESAAESRQSFNVYQKVGVNDWLDMGLHQIERVDRELDRVIFELVSCLPDN